MHGEPNGSASAHKDTHFSRHIQIRSHLRTVKDRKGCQSEQGAEAGCLYGYREAGSRLFSRQLIPHLNHDRLVCIHTQGVSAFGALPHHRHRLSCGPHPHRLFPARQRNRRAAHRRGHRPDSDSYLRPDKDVFLHALSLLDRLLRGARLFQVAPRIGRAASALCCDHERHMLPCHSRHRAPVWLLQRGDGGAFLRIADLLGAPRRWHRGHTEAGLRRRHGEARARHCACVLCRDLYIRHFRHRDHSRQSRAKAARRYRQGEGSDSGVGRNPQQGKRERRSCNNQAHKRCELPHISCRLSVFRHSAQGQ